MKFESLFGIKPTTIQKLCVIAPFLHKGMLEQFGIAKLIKGRPYSCGQAQNFTLIYTQIGAPNVGDAVLYLQDTPCERIIFVGSCGLLQEKDSLDIGSLTTPQLSLNLESFSQLALKKLTRPTKAYPHKKFLAQFHKHFQNENIVPLNCATMGSIKLEEEYWNALRKQKIDILDMECSAFFSAAQAVKLPALSILYITDILKKHHPLQRWPSSHQQKISHAQEKLCEIILKFAQND